MSYYLDGAIATADAHLSIADLPSYSELVDLLRQALPIIDAHRRAALGDGDLTAYSIRYVLGKTGGEK